MTAANPPLEDAQLRVLNHPNFERLDEEGTTKFLKAAELTNGDWEWIAEGLHEGWIEVDGWSSTATVSARTVVRMWIRDSLTVFNSTPNDHYLLDYDRYLKFATADELRAGRDSLNKLIEASELYGIEEWLELEGEMK